MTVPDYQSLMLPMLQVLSDGAERELGDVRRQMALAIGLTEDDLREKFPSGSNYVWISRFHWAKTYLAKAGVVDTVRRGVVLISQRGRDLLAEHPQRIDNATLARFAEFRDWKEAEPKLPGRTDSAIEAHPASSPPLSPDDAMERGYIELRRLVEDELLARLRQGSWEFFEDLVPRLMAKLGYGGVEERPKRTSDGGIDGIIREDRLGLENIYVQAKRWEKGVGRPDVQAFVGSLVGQHASKGVFVTTSTFSREAVEYVARLQQRIILIDGPRLAQLMFDADLGVATDKVYAVKRLDTDYFVDA